jgi:hypothetical protein
MQDERRMHTPAWLAQCWLSFLLATGTTLFGIYHLPADLWVRGFLAMGLLFTMGSSFTLAKTLRDDHEAKRLVNRLTEAKTERILREFEPV